MAVANEIKTVVGVFSSVRLAQDAVSALEREGIRRDDISIVAHQNAAGYDTLEDRDKTSDVVADAGIGAAIGGLGGLLLAAAGAITVPVIGPVLAAGPIAAALTGAGIGAAAGGLIGALTESGIPEEDAKYYAEGVRRGDVLVTVRTADASASRIQDIMDDHGAVDVDQRVASWRDRGWGGYDAEAKPYSAEEIRTERSYYRDDAPRREYTGTTSDPDARGRGSYSSEMRTEPSARDPRDLDKDGDVNALERGAHKAKEGMRNLKDTMREGTAGGSDAYRRRYSRIYDRPFS